MTETLGQTNLTASQWSLLEQTDYKYSSNDLMRQTHYVIVLVHFKYRTSCSSLNRYIKLGRGILLYN